MHVIIVGRSREDKENMTSVLVRGLESANSSYIRVDGLPFPEDIRQDSVVVYASSKERFAGVLKACQERHLRLVVISSINAVEIPQDVAIPVIRAPNLALLFLALFDVLPRFGKLVQMLGARTCVVEAHQASKTSAASTAQTIAGWFDVDPNTIGSIRNDAIAEAVLDVPEKKTGGYAKHFVDIRAHGATVRIEFEVIGREAYFLGLQAVLSKIADLGPDLRIGVHDAHRLIFAEDKNRLDFLELIRRTASPTQPGFFFSL